jgi:hypothetical protein
VSTINGVFLLLLLLLLSAPVSFLPEGDIVEFRNFAWGFNSQKRFGVNKNLGVLGFFGKKSKVLRIA